MDINLNMIEEKNKTTNKTFDMKIDKRRELLESVARKMFLLNACIAVICVAAITFFVFYKGLQPFFSGNAEGTYSLVDFLTGTQWRPNDDINSALYGILYMICGSLMATVGAIIIGVPIGILSAVFISQIAPKNIKRIIKPAVELLAGIPSVIYGVFGLGIIVPKIMEISPRAQGQSLLAVIMVLTIMILPTVITISESAINAVPQAYIEGSYGLGASKIQTIFKVILPAAKSGILAGVVLGIGRAIGETMAVMLVAGNPIAGIPTSIWDPIRPLTTNIAMEMGYAFGLHQEILFSTGVVLFIFIIILNLILNRITAKAGEK
ncbi:phosphate ABC transporter permease subunit PstC [Vallitalea guaymasensis]|uniref:phosphate ABC transporter permease subunit PstC n=1 Tax=Vallitalea guaymasensis TaxID=1185412 RepID=UPI002E8E230D|nr:phosphate ABC transporter permease subunit PstC [Vallitalea guaymasensis]